MITLRQNSGMVKLVIKRIVFEPLQEEAIITWSHCGFPQGQAVEDQPYFFS